MKRHLRAIAIGLGIFIPVALILSLIVVLVDSGIIGQLIVIGFCIILVAWTIGWGVISEERRH
jgi:hypothetical protein